MRIFFGISSSYPLAHEPHVDHVASPILKITVEQLRPYGKQALSECQTDKSGSFLPVAKQTGRLLFLFQKKAKTFQMNIIAYVIWAKNFKSYIRSDHGGCLEALEASKGVKGFIP